MSFLARLEYTINPSASVSVPSQPAEMQSPLSQQRVSMWLAVTPLVQEIYLLLDEYTANAELKDGHILQNNHAINHLLSKLHELYLKVKDDAYFSYLFFGAVGIEEQDLSAIFYRYGKGSVNPVLYAIVRFEKESKALTYLTQTSEHIAFDYIFQRLDDELFKEYIARCKKERTVMVGLFDFAYHIQQNHPEPITYAQWFMDMHYTQVYTPHVREKLDLLLEKVLFQAKQVTAPTLNLLKVLDGQTAAV